MCNVLELVLDMMLAGQLGMTKGEDATKINAEMVKRALMM